MACRGASWTDWADAEPALVLATLAFYKSSHGAGKTVEESRPPEQRDVEDSEFVHIPDLGASEPVT